MSLLREMVKKAKTKKPTVKKQPEGKIKSIDLRGDNNSFKNTMDKIEKYNEKFGNARTKTSTKKDGRPKMEIGLAPSYIPKMREKKKFVAKKGKDGRVNWELVLNWKTTRRSDTTQKLGFKAGITFKEGMKEADRILNMLRVCGDYKEQDVDLIFVGREGTLEAFNAERKHKASGFLESIKKKG